MVVEVDFMCFSGGNILKGENGVYYDREPVKIISVQDDSKYVELLSEICMRLRINASSHGVELFHRYPMPTRSNDGGVHYHLVPINDDRDVARLIRFAKRNGLDGTEQLFIQTSNSCLPQSGVQCSEQMLHGNHPSSSQARPWASYEVENASDRDDLSDEYRSTDEESSESEMVRADWDDVGCEVGSSKKNIGRPAGSSKKPMIGSIGQPVPFFTEMGDVQRCSFEQMHQIGLDNWSLSDEFKKGMRFNTKENLQYAVKMHHIQNHFNFSVVDSEPRLWSVQCVHRDKGCRWRLRACMRRKDDVFEITKFEGPHTCVNPMLDQDHSQLDANLMARDFINHVSLDPDVKISHLRTIIRDTYKYMPTRRRVFEAKRKALALVYGDWERSYSDLPHLLNAIRKANPGTQYIWDGYNTNVAGEVVFGRIFWSFGPCIEAFKYCRPVVSIDGTFLYGKYKHKLLIACSVDGDNHILPIGFAVVDEETYESWAWFLKCLRRYVVDERDGPICLISDRHVGIRVAVADAEVGWAPPFAEWRFCIRHIASNFNSLHKTQKGKKMVVAAGLQARHTKWQLCMEKLREIKADATDYFMNIPTEQWTLSHDGGLRFGHMTTNLSECYNAVLKGARKLPIAALVEKTFYNCVSIFNTRRADARRAIESHEDLCTYAAEILYRWRSVASGHKVISYDHGDGTFEVVTGVRQTTWGLKGGTRRTVQISNRMCTCGKWQIYKIPCSHAIAACASMHVDVGQFIGHWYRWDHQLQCYDKRFNPYGDKCDWEYVVDIPKILPDVGRMRPKGRPKSTRIRNEMDIRVPVVRSSCGICGQEGHNSRKCPQKDH